MPSLTLLRAFGSCVTVCAAALIAAPATAQVSFEEAPIDYHHAPLADPIFQLQKKLDAGRTKLSFDVAEVLWAQIFEPIPP